MKTLGPGVARVLKRLHYPLEVNLTCVLWYVAYPLSLRHLEEMMCDEKFDDLVKQVQVTEIEITRCDTTIRALWSELKRLARLGIAASTEHQHLIEVENERQRWISLRERIHATISSAGR